MRGCGFWLLNGLIVLVSVCSWILIDYPPSSSQIGLGLNPWLVRLLAMMAVGGATIFWLARFGKIAVFLTLVSPLTWGLIMTRPVEAWLMAAVIGLVANRKMWLICGLLVVLALTSWGKTNISSNFEIKQVSEKTIKRITDEDGLTEKVELPMTLRRLANNKLTTIGTNVWKEVVRPVDLESLFFQEINPLSRKSLPIFFWPTILLLPFGLYAVRKKEVVILLAGYLYFLITSGDDYIRYSWMLVGLVVTLSYGWRVLVGINKVAGYFVLGLIGYGFISFSYDFSKRSDYWLDNRPLLYRNIYHLVADSAGDKVVITDLIGNSRKYCDYFLGDKCDGLTFGIDNKAEPKSGDWQIGFIGEFAGTEFNNKFDETAKKKIEESGWKIVGGFKIRDSVAYRYGDEVILAKYE
jgi:hypothetical protein